MKLLSDTLFPALQTKMPPKNNLSSGCPNCGFAPRRSGRLKSQRCPQCGDQPNDTPSCKETHEKVAGLFREVSELNPSQRPAFLQRVGDADSPLRRRLEELLENARREDSFLDLPETHSDGDETGFGVSPEQTSIGNYNLLSVIGEGGMGTVFMAEQLRPIKRMVAIKVIRGGLDRNQVVARFETERQSLALMDHPNIAKVFEGGETERGEPYFVMELVKGEPITKYCDNNKLSAAARVDLMAQVCKAVQHAHQKGVIHRDLKPSNILVAQYDEAAVPKVIDFGVAKAMHEKLTEKTLCTQFGQIVGTLEYMSPEQAVLNHLDVDTRSDIYSLGVVLYELLVGRTPLDDGKLGERALDDVLRSIREREPQRPSLRLSSQGKAANHVAAFRKTDRKKLGKMLRGDLDWIVMKALEKNRERRYETAEQMGKDLVDYLSGNVVSVRPPSVTYRLAKTYQRHRFRFIASVIVAIGMLFAIAAIVVSNYRLRDREYIARFHEISHAWEIGDVRRMRDALHDLSENASHEFEYEFFQRRLQSVDTESQSGSYVQSHVDGIAYLREDSRSIEINGRSSIGSETPINYFSIAYDGNTIAVLNRGVIEIHRWRNDRWAQTNEIKMSGEFETSSYLLGSIDLSDDGSHVVSIVIDGDDKRVALFDTDTTKLLWSHPVSSRKDDRVQARFNLGGKLIHVAAETLFIRSFWTSSGEEVRRVQLEAPSFLMETDRDNQLVVGGGASSILFHVSDDGQVNPVHRLPLRAALAAEFSRDGSRLAVSDRQTINLYDLSQQTPLRLTRYCHEAMVDSIAFDKGGKVVSSQGTIRKSWEASDPARLAKRHFISGYGHYFQPLDVGSEWVATAITEDRVGSFHLKSGARRVHSIHDDIVLSVAVSPDDQWIASASRFGDIQLADGGVSQELYFSAEDEIWSVAFSPNGDYLVAGGTNGTILVWNTPNWDSYTRIPCDPSHRISRLAFSSDGKYLVAAGSSGGPNRSDQEYRSGCALLLETSKFKKLDERFFDDRVYDVTFSPTHAEQFALSIRHGDVMICEVDTGSGTSTINETGVQMTASPYFVQSMSFGPHGRRLITASPNGQIRIWRVRDGAEIASFDSGRKPREIQFTPDHKYLLTANQEGIVEVMEAR